MFSMKELYINLCNEVSTIFSNCLPPFLLTGTTFDLFSFRLTGTIFGIQKENTLSLNDFK